MGAVEKATQRIREFAWAGESAAIALALRIIVEEWGDDPDSFGDNEADFRNALMDIAQDIRD